MENIHWSWFWNKYKFNKEFSIGRCSLKKIGLCMYTYYICTPSYMEGFFSKQKVSSLGNAINPTFSKGESSEIISLTVPSTYIILIHEPKFFFLEQNLWTTSTLYYGIWVPSIVTTYSIIAGINASWETFVLAQSYLVLLQKWRINLILIGFK